ncbi:hypothetical protein BCV70DRAFT_198585 [Testicularia cyperi]|uniref:Tetratricopeptide SHNi-TPR domain-containing protein n=1 Tax=Testicularia cyperi TaxID=1882483 RepID=A0A317XVI5_9BASI|nr:hypothetical protein BCV70DRAFT_198585 [Testicularia cyperi]
MALSEQPGIPTPAVEAEATAASGADGIPARQLIDEAKRHFALKEYMSAIDKLATALEELRESHAEDADLLAPILHLYGRSLLENFILNSAALGGGGGAGPSSASAPSAPKATASSSSAAAGSSSSSSAKPVNDPRFSFSGDAEEFDDDDDDEAAGQAGAAEDEDDDLQVAFAVLDLARVIYERILSSDSPSLTTLESQTWSETRTKAELAEVMNDLGDVGLENENFQQSSDDYQKSLDILTPLLNPHSRRLADAHLRLGLALEFHPDVEPRQGAKKHVQAASDVLGARIKAIEARIAASDDKTAENASTDSTADAAAPATNGKSKANDDQHEKDDLLEMGAEKLTSELSDVKSIKAELDDKLREYESDAGSAKLNGQPDLAGFGGPDAVGNTKEALQQAIRDAFAASAADTDDANGNAAFAAPSSAAATNAPVNNLSGMVKRKKKSDDPTTETATETESSESTSKKARVEDA